MRLYPGFSDPPENTVEFWSNARGRYSATAAAAPDTPRRDPGTLDPGLEVLLCIKDQLDGFGDQGLSGALQCLTPKCSDMCKMYNSVNCFATCLKYAYGYSPSYAQRVQGFGERPVSYRGILRSLARILSSVDVKDRSAPYTQRREPVPQNLVSDLVENISTLRPDILDVQILPFRREGKRAAIGRRYRQMAKRYRLGLYDCISSYCGSLKGESRKSCIVNLCHRSAQIED